MQQATQTSQSNEPNFVAFRIADQEYCVDIMSVREIRGWTPVTTLPQAPSSVLGVINLRGSVVPILDFSKRLGLKSQDPTVDNVIIIVQVDSQTIGLLVDEVSEILSIEDAAIKPTPEVTFEGREAFITGVITFDSRMIRLVDLSFVVLADLRSKTSTEIT